MTDSQILDQVDNEGEGVYMSVLRRSNQRLSICGAIEGLGQLKHRFEVKGTDAYLCSKNSDS